MQADLHPGSHVMKPLCPSRRAAGPSRHGITLRKLLLVTVPLVVVGAVAWSVVTDELDRARTARCASNLYRLSIAFRLYTEDYNDTAPPAEQWSTGFSPYMDKSEWSKAAAWFRKAIEVDPFDEQTHAALGAALLESGDVAGAEREYSAVCTLKPEEPDGFSGLADVYDRKGDSEKAAEYKKRAESLGGGRGSEK